MSDTSNNRPWYKQFWPWFLIAVPLMSMVLSFTMMNLAINTEDSLVIDDYYKEGKGINLNLTRVQEARVKGIQTTLTFSQNAVVLHFVHGAPEDGAALRLEMRHATLKTKDFDLLLVKDALGDYRAALPGDVAGTWQVSLFPLSEAWRITQRIALPRNDAINFNP